MVFVYDPLVRRGHSSDYLTNMSKRARAIMGNTLAGGNGGIVVIPPPPRDKLP